MLLSYYKVFFIGCRARNLKLDYLTYSSTLQCFLVKLYTFLQQNENIYLNPGVYSQCQMEMDRFCHDVPAGGGKVQMCTVLIYLCVIRVNHDISSIIYHVTGIVHERNFFL